MWAHLNTNAKTITFYKCLCHFAGLQTYKKKKLNQHDVTILQISNFSGSPL